MGYNLHSVDIFPEQTVPSITNDNDTNDKTKAFHKFNTFKKTKLLYIEG